MPNKPRPYKGQDPRVEDEADEYSCWHDLSDPGLNGTDNRDAEDALDPDRPTGASTTRVQTNLNPYGCTPCPVCGEFANGADRTTHNPNVYCRNNHSWRRVQMQSKSASEIDGVRWFRNADQRKK